MIDPEKLSHVADNMTEHDMKEAKLYAQMAEALVNTAAESSDCNPHRMLSKLVEYTESLNEQIKLASSWIGFEHIR